MQVSNAISTVPLPYLDHWFHVAMTYDDLKKQVSSGCLKSLTPDDRSFILDFVTKKGWLHHAVKTNDWEFVEALSDAGVNLNALDEQGNSILVYTNRIGKFRWLQQQGVQFSHESNWTLLKRVLGRCEYGTEKDEWYRLLLETIKEAPLEDYCTLDSDELRSLALLSNRDFNLGCTLSQIVKRLVQEKPNEALNIAHLLLTNLNYPNFFLGFIYLIKSKIIESPFIEQVLTDPEIAFLHVENDHFFKLLEEYWNPTEEVKKTLAEEIKKTVAFPHDLRIFLYIKALLNTKTLKEAARLYYRLNINMIYSLNKTTRTQLQDHIIALQAKEKSTIWIAMANKENCCNEELHRIKKLGFDPKWVDPIHQQSFLFTQSVKILGDDIDDFGFDLHHVDGHGNNALEHHCIHFTEGTMPALKILSDAGLKLEDQFPNVQKCRNIFPENLYFQAVLGTLLLHGSKSRRLIFRCIYRTGYPEFCETLLNDLELKNIFEKTISHPFGNRKFQIESEEEVNWENLFHPADFQKLKNSNPKKQASEEAYLAEFWERIASPDILNKIPDSSLVSFINDFIKTLRQNKEQINEWTHLEEFCKTILNEVPGSPLFSLVRDAIKTVYEKKAAESEWVYLAQFWDGVVPSDILDEIPDSPLASLVIGAIKAQHQKIVEKKIIKAASPEKIFISSLTHNDMVHLNRYIFCNPEFMKILMQDYMNAKIIDIRTCGRSKATYGRFISKLIIRMGKLSQLPAKNLLPKKHRNLLKAFNTAVTPTPVETLHLSEDAEIRVQGRTVVVTSKNKDHCEALKFLKKGEKYDFFSQEHSVSEALTQFGDELQSQILKPIGIYAVKHLPPALTPYQHQLPADLKYAFHYQAAPGTFIYLPDVPPKKYPKSREKMLHDASQLIHLGIYLDIAAMFHDQEGFRRHVLLLELMGQIGNCVGIRRCTGRLKTPFVEIQYSNARETGMTDWRDASIYYENASPARDIFLSSQKDDAAPYYYQVHALSNVLLIDMLILAERYLKEGLLQWKNEDFNQKFGLDLAEGFAHLTASYSNQPYEASLKFALECGIDWTRAARQISFWLDTGPEGYPKWIVQGKVPPGLYEDSINVRVNAFHSKNFDEVQGFRTNGNLDIGPYNGPLALDEFEKAAHLLFNTVALAEPLSPFDLNLPAQPAERTDIYVPDVYI